MIATIHARALAKLLHAQYDLGLRTDIVEDLAHEAHSVSFDRDGVLRMYIPAASYRLLRTLELACQGRENVTFTPAAGGDTELALTLYRDD